MPELFYQLGRLLGSSWLYIVISSLMILAPKYRSNIYWGLVGLILNALLNFNLKLFFKIPLSYKSHGFAFPSGHMQAASFILLWLALTRFFKLEFYFLPILAWIGASLIHYGYHTLTEVVGGFAFASIFCSFYWYLYRKTTVLPLMSILIFTGLFILYFLQTGFDFKIQTTSLVFLCFFVLQWKLAPKGKP